MGGPFCCCITRGLRNALQLNENQTKQIRMFLKLAICHAFEHLALGSGISAAAEAAAAAAKEAAGVGGGDGGVFVEQVDKDAADGPPTTILRRLLGLHLRADDVHNGAKVEGLLAGALTEIASACGG